MPREIAQGARLAIELDVTVGIGGDAQHLHPQAAGGCTALPYPEVGHPVVEIPPG
jgi:hypothetical protein